MKCLFLALASHDFTTIKTALFLKQSSSLLESLAGRFCAGPDY
ncbi:similar to RIKEN cDNA 3110031B13, isoform CRA_b [Rattus norvegicus]|uniref:Similar to RIKEN cDNA 3110031B13, isoform CRA_b n=1 Tax=Rattus norvegicus TaxID=10116 RepID=A6I5G4_RAT|nr:similar to RIKEN cDNA 3110031B13, isoform CRA_b [Rattus norvegicus]